MLINFVSHKLKPNLKGEKFHVHDIWVMANGKQILLMCESYRGSVQILVNRSTKYLI